jgi:hypothetical protein
MADPILLPPPHPVASGACHWKIWAIAAATTLVAAFGTWVAGQYQIGRLDTLRDRYSQPVADFAQSVARARPQSMEADLLESCKQVQIGTWLQTTDALKFVDPVSGNRIVVRLDPAKSQIDLNGRELASCVSDEIENRQFDIGSMTNTWALVLALSGLGLGVWSWFGWESWRRKTKAVIVQAETVPSEDNPSP